MTRRAETIRIAAQASADRSALTAPLRALESGAWIGWPSETVYAVAARADHADFVRGWQRLVELASAAGLELEAPPTWLVASPTALERFERVSPMARRLVERYWPGPLTLELPGRATGVERASRYGWTRVRRPAHAAAQALLDAAPFPIVAATASGAVAALRSADALAGTFGEGLAVIVDSGPSKLGEDAVLLAVGPARFELLREGILDLSALRATAGLRIGFVCTGNTCRSPMAEGLARSALARRLGVQTRELAKFGFELQSMGVFAAPGAEASQHAIDVLRERGIDISRHRSQPAIPDQVAKLDRVYALTRSHLNALEQGLPPGRSKHCALLDPGGRDIADPIGGPRGDYEVVAEQIAAAIDKRLEEWA